MGQAYGNWYWARQWRNKPNAEPKSYRVGLILEYRKYRAMLQTAPVEVNVRGNEIYRNEDADAKLGVRRGDSRYFYDFGKLQSWKQFDTEQDASYFGVWVDVPGRRTFTYCEGDRTLVVCPTLESFRAELKDAEEFYGAPPPMAIGFDANGARTDYYDTRPVA
jgi:hypothetical protein